MSGTDSGGAGSATRSWWLRTTRGVAGATVLGIVLCSVPGPVPHAQSVPSSLPSGESDPAGVPDDATLERLGAVIGTIEIDNQDIFNLDDPRENRALYRVANRWHVQTRPATIQRHLLFASGDRYSRRLLQESARMLRSLRHLYDASVEPVGFADGKVDIRVTTRDVWSLNPGVSFGRKGGKNTSGFEIEELNFLGLGVAFALSHKSSVDRDSDKLSYFDRRFLGTWAELVANYENNSDGNAWVLGLDRPFFALDTRWSAGVRSEGGERIDPLYVAGEVAQEFGERHRLNEVHAGWSAGLVDGWTRRWSWGITYDQHRFSPLPGPLSGPLPQDRLLVYPWIGFEAIEDDFDTLVNHDQIERTEDFFLGTRWTARLGYATTGFGADRDAWVFNAGAEHALKPTPSSKLLLASHLQGRYEDSGLANTRLDGSARFYLEQSERRLFFATIEGEYGRRLDRDQQILIGGDSGLRGYPLRYAGGESRAHITLEQRYFTDWYPFRLFRVGGAIFADVGRTWGDDGFGTPNPGLLRDVGFGLRLGNSRSGLGNIVHIDLAFPLDGDSSISNVQFLIETRREF